MDVNPGSCSSLDLK